MGVTKLRSIFMRFILFLIAGAGFIVVLNLGLYLYGVDTGHIYPLHKMTAEMEQAKSKLQTVNEITDDIIPSFSKYALYTKEGEYIRGSVKVKDAPSIWERAVQNKQISSSSFLYTVINRDQEVVVLKYLMTAQFHNPVVQRFIPSADLFVILVALLELLILLLCVSYLFGRYIKKRMDTLLAVVQKVEHQDLDFEIKKTKLFEIDQLLDALEQMRQALKKSLSEQWQADKMRQEQISALAHDLKTPLTIIRGNAELLSDTELSDEQREYADYIGSSSIQIQTYIQTLIEVARSWDSYPLQLSPTSLEPFLAELENQAKGLCFVQQINLEWECKLQSLRIDIDRHLLMRALVNVVANAVEHTPAGGTIAINVDEQDNKLLFIITDTGNGFSDEALKYGAEPFFMGDSSRHSKSHFGIGLFVAHSACQKHGGELILENRSGGECDGVSESSVYGNGGSNSGGGRVTLVVPVH